ncbi:MAG: 50S ribosomal protein L29 [Patescibacteria group bacterium]|nr:50S ribosomal protein L29 [Patescibacteria group bacterium]
MKNNQKKELAGKNEAELSSLVKQNREELAQLVLDKNIGKLKNRRLLFHKRKDLARLLTVLRQKELANA